MLKGGGVKTTARPPGVGSKLMRGKSESMKQQQQPDLDMGPEVQWLRRSREAYDASTTWFENTQKVPIENGRAHFNNKHKPSSKFNSGRYKNSTTLFSPKTRSVIRKNEAACATAFFSNQDVLNITASQGSDKSAVVGAAIMKQLLQYRCVHTLKWFQFVLGAFQDTMKSRVAISRVQWKHVMRPKAGKKPDEIDIGQDPSDTPYDDKMKMVRDPKDYEVVESVPEVSLIPVENFRVDPSCNWTDPVNTSPYIIETFPLYVYEVKQKIAAGEWLDVPAQYFAQQTRDEAEMTIKQLEGEIVNQQQQVNDYHQVWVQRHIHDIDGEDWEWYTLDKFCMLAKPMRLSKVERHDERPYTVGYSNLESHEVFPASLSNLLEGTQEEANEIMNQVLENLKFILNKRLLVKRGKNVDLETLLVNRPGTTTMVDDPQTDVKALEYADITPSSGPILDRNNAAFDELAGNFSAASVLTSGNLGNTARGMGMLQNPANILTEYAIRIFAVTFVLPTLKLLAKVESVNETDEKLLRICGEKGEIFKRYGATHITADVLEHDFDFDINVGFNNTDPMFRSQTFIQTIQMANEITMSPNPSMNKKEIVNELFSIRGYSDGGTRFLANEDPEVARLTQQVQQLSQQLQMAGVKIKEKTEGHHVSLAKSKIAADATIKKTVIHELEQNKRTIAEHAHAIHELDMERHMRHEENMHQDTPHK